MGKATHMIYMKKTYTIFLVYKDNRDKKDKNMNEQTLSLIVGNMAVILPLFLWVRSEANADRREAAQGRKDIMAVIQGIQLEMKDFHGRLCAIEERRLKQEEKK